MIQLHVDLIPWQRQLWIIAFDQGESVIEEYKNLNKVVQQKQIKTLFQLPHYHRHPGVGDAQVSGQVGFAPAVIFEHLFKFNCPDRTLHLPVFL